MRCARRFVGRSADGIVLLSSYGDRWIGDEAFAPVLTEKTDVPAVLARLSELLK